MDRTFKTPRNDQIEMISDVELQEDVLYTNNTFSLRALNETLERLSLVNFWSLYQTQRARLHMERFDIPFSEFKPILRLTGEKSKDYFPRRYMAYVDYTFIRPELRKKFKNSEFYNIAIDQVNIAANPNIFRYNHLVFIDGDYIFTTEVYPQESKTGIIIDVENNRNEHGISYADYVRYSTTNPMVTIFMVPNFAVSTLTTNQYALDGYSNAVPFEKIKGSEKFTNQTLCFINAEKGLARRFWSAKVDCNTDEKIVEFGNDLGAGDAKYLMCFLTFQNLFSIRSVTKEYPFFQVNSKMPCPKEQMIIMIRDDETGRCTFKQNLGIAMYYPNIYEVTGLGDDETGIVFIMQDEEMVTENEEYASELAKYDEYIQMLPQYEEKTIPEIIKHYRPSSYVYSIDDFEGQINMPDTLSYKIQKLRQTIYENPWALAVYLDLLNIPMDKFYLDMEKIDLEHRIRTDTSEEDIYTGSTIAEFDEERYVFAMNRHFVDTRSYGFRVFIDGLFQRESEYTVVPGPNFYYIYIPVSKITPTTMIEIERYKLFTVEKRGTTDSLDKPVLELDFSESRQMVGYSREIYAVDIETLMYIPKKYLRLEVLYKFAEGADRWVTIPAERNVPLENKVRLYITDEWYLNRKIRAGIQRRVAMATGNVYHETNTEKDKIYWYTKGEIGNFGGFNRGNYRVFNNGRILLPIQYYVNLSEKYGGDDFFRTSCELREGDQFTIDHVPAQFRVVYYQHEIDEVNKRGYVDVNGKLALPISLKWYDIYLNGRKLHKKNIEIISPTRFYIQGVESRLHLMIVVKNRDPEFFHMPYFEGSLDKPENSSWNNTVMDELMDVVGGLKDVIDSSKVVIDPNNSFMNIATNICMNINALVFFFEHFTCTFINANKKQITQEIKDAFPMLLDENGVMPIDSNEGAISSPEIGGYLIKLIDCNIERGEEDMFTDPHVNYDGIGALQDRFAIRPLNTDKYEYALTEEFMTDPNTAEPSILNEDGTVTALNTMVRTNHHIEVFSSRITTYGMGQADIYQLEFPNEFKTLVYQNDNNLITEPVEISSNVRKVCISIDATFLTKYGDCKMLKVANVDPTVVVEYTAGDETKSIECTLTRLKDNIIEEKNKVVTISRIVLTGIPDTVTKSFVHSVLLAF